MSLCDKMGGPQSIQQVVDGFYQHMINDPKIAEYFKNTDIPKQIKRTTQYMIMATGGPKPNTGFDLKKTHAKLGITKDQFDCSWGDFQKAMKENKMEDKLIKEAKAVFYSVIGDIVSA